MENIRGQTVTQAARTSKQPRGGYIKSSAFTVETYKELYLSDQKDEIIGPSVVGTATDNITRFYFSNGHFNKTFNIALKGLEVLKRTKNTIIKMGAKMGTASEYIAVFNKAKNYIAINSPNGGLDLNIVFYGVIISMFDSIYRAGIFPDLYRIKVLQKQLDNQYKPLTSTLINILKMVKSCIAFFGDKKGLTFGETFATAYTPLIVAGDCDYIDRSTLWDLKVIKKDIKIQAAKEITLQLAIYFLMGKMSGKKVFKDLTHIGVFNPRLNKSYRYDMRSLDQRLIDKICKSIIGYSMSWNKKLNKFVK